MSTKIKFKTNPIAWTEGGIMHLDVKASAGSVISINWGNGRNTTHEFHIETKKDFSHNYFPRHNKVPLEFESELFLVEISTKSLDTRIIGFSLSTEMATFDLDVSACPELEELYYESCHDSSKLDLSCNTALKSLSCRLNGLTRLDLSNNTALEHLYCGSNRLSHLSLMNNFALKTLDCEFNEMGKLFICYAPQLREAAFEEGNNLDEATIMQIREMVAENAENE